MGTFEKGYLGGFSGKVGTAVGSSWKKLNVLRSNPPSKRRVRQLTSSCSARQNLH